MKDTRSRPFIVRKVTGVHNYIDPHANGTKGSNILYLECGHFKVQKGSIKVPETCRYTDCARLRAAEDWITEIGGCREEWNTETQMPRRYNIVTGEEVSTEFWLRLF